MGSGTAHTEGASFQILSRTARGFEQVPALEVAQTEQLWRRVPARPPSFCAGFPGSCHLIIDASYLEKHVLVMVGDDSVNGLRMESKCCSDP